MPSKCAYLELPSLVIGMCEVKRARWWQKCAIANVPRKWYTLGGGIRSGNSTPCGTTACGTANLLPQLQSADYPYVSYFTAFVSGMVSLSDFLSSQTEIFMKPQKFKCSLRNVLVAGDIETWLPTLTISDVSTPTEALSTSFSSIQLPHRDPRCWHIACFAYNQAPIDIWRCLGFPPVVDYPKQISSFG